MTVLSGMFVNSVNANSDKGKVSNPLISFPDWKHPNLESQERYYLREARKIGPCMHTLVNRLLSDSHPLSIRRVRGLFFLSKRFGPAVIEDAALQACNMHFSNYHLISSICEKIAAGNENERAITQHHELIRPLEEYESLVMERTASCQ